MGFADGYKTYDTSNGFGHSKKWKTNFNFRMSGEDADAILKDQEETPYQILGILDNSTKEEIKKGYKTQMLKWHPDRNPDNILKATERSQQINAAYSKLMNNS